MLKQLFFMLHLIFMLLPSAKAHDSCHDCFGKCILKSILDASCCDKKLCIGKCKDGKKCITKKMNKTEDDIYTWCTGKCVVLEEILEKVSN